MKIIIRYLRKCHEIMSQSNNAGQKDFRDIDYRSF